MIRKIQQVKAINGSIIVPGDKSISHRTLLLGVIAEGNTFIHNISPAVDVRSTMICLKQLNAEIIDAGDAIEIKGKGLYGLTAPPSFLDCGNSGTTMRLLSGILAAQPFTSILIGDDSLSKRPMTRIIEPLSQMGATIESKSGGVAPLMIHGTHLRPIYYRTPVASAQIKSCVLLAGLYADGTTTVIEPNFSRDHTERMLTDFGIPIKRQNLAVSVSGPVKFKGCDIKIPGDFSSAAFFIGAAVITPNSELEIKNIGLNNTRIGFLDVLSQMGADIKIQYHDDLSSEPTGNVTVSSSQLNGVEIQPELIPKLIDEIPILAIIATQAKGKTILTGAKELRIKESDRLNAITKNLTLMGVKIEENDNGFVIEGPQKLKGAIINSSGDHRIAMAFSIAGLIAEGETQLINAQCVNISMPNFFETLQGVVLE